MRDSIPGLPTGAGLRRSARCRPAATAVPSHVRPRPPSTGRPAPQRVRVPAPDAYRLKQAPGSSSAGGACPCRPRSFSSCAVVALGGPSTLRRTGGIGSLVRPSGRPCRGSVDELTATTPALPRRRLSSPASPLIASPTEPYTNQPRVDLEVTVPDEYVGDPGVHVRIYLTLRAWPRDDRRGARGLDHPAVVPVDLTPGRNDFTATMIEAGVESEASPVVTFILDTEVPQFVTPAQDGETSIRDRSSSRARPSPEDAPRPE